jgi:CHAD domain-containing protein
MSVQPNVAMLRACIKSVLPSDACVPLWHCSTDISIRLPSPTSTMSSAASAAYSGGARDWDVFVLETLSAAEKGTPAPARLDPLRKAAEGERLTAHHAVCTELSTACFARLVIGIAASIADGISDLQRKEHNSLQAPIAGIAPDLLDRMARKVDKRGRHLDKASHEQLRALRKAIKKLRYSVEFLSALYPRKEVKAYLRPCKSLQKLLGTVNDAAATPTLSAQLPKTGEDLAPGISAPEDWVTTNGKKARHHVSKPWHKLQSADPSWG